MKKFVLALGAAAAIAAAASVTPAEAGFKGCCGGWNPQPHWGGGISVGIGVGSVGVVDPGFSAGGCYYAYRKVLIPNIGIVMKKQLVCV
jgi:hypothetical protein